MAITAVVRALARRWGFLDRPDKLHKGHVRPVALGGGVAVFSAVLVAIVIAVLVVTKTFGHVEWQLITDRLRFRANRLMSRDHLSNGKHVQESHVRLKGSRQWDDLWTGLTEAAERYDLLFVQLTLDLPTFDETFYARWKCSQTGVSEGDERCWRVECPLLADGHVAGKLVLVGTSPDGSNIRQIGVVADFLEPVEDGVRRMVAEIVQDAAVRSAEGLPTAEGLSAS